MKRQEYIKLVDDWNSFLLKEEKRLLNEQLLVESILLNENIMAKIRASTGKRKIMNALMVMTMLGNIATSSVSMAKGGVSLKDNVEQVANTKAGQKFLDEVGVDSSAVAAEAGKLDQDGNKAKLKKFREESKKLKAEFMKDGNRAAKAIDDSAPPSLKGSTRDNTYASSIKLAGKADIQKLMDKNKAAIDVLLADTDTFGLYAPRSSKSGFLASMEETMEGQTSFNSNSKSDILLMAIARGFALRAYKAKYGSQIEASPGISEFEVEYFSIDADDKNLTKKVADETPEGEDQAFALAQADAEHRKSFVSKESKNITGNINVLALQIFGSQQFVSGIGIGSIDSAEDMRGTLDEITDGINFEDSFVWDSNAERLSADEIEKMLNERMNYLSDLMVRFYARNHDEFDNSQGLEDDSEWYDGSTTNTTGERSNPPTFIEAAQDSPENAKAIKDAVNAVREFGQLTSGGTITGKRSLVER